MGLRPCSVCAWGLPASVSSRKGFMTWWLGRLPFSDSYTVTPWRSIRAFVRAGLWCRAALWLFRTWIRVFADRSMTACAMWDKCTDAITAFFQRVQLPALRRFLAVSMVSGMAAACRHSDCRLEYFVDGGADSLYYAVAASGTMRSAARRTMEAEWGCRGDWCDVLMIEQRLEETLRREAVSAGFNLWWWPPDEVRRLR